MAPVGYNSNSGHLEDRSIPHKIKGRDITIERELLNVSSSKLREFFSFYQPICENFSYNNPEYIQIFDSKIKSFRCGIPMKPAASIPSRCSPA